MGGRGHAHVAGIDIGLGWKLPSPRAREAAHNVSASLIAQHAIRVFAQARHVMVVCVLATNEPSPPLGGASRVSTVSWCVPVLRPPSRRAGLGLRTSKPFGLARVVIEADHPSLPLPGGHERDFILCPIRRRAGLGLHARCAAGLRRAAHWLWAWRQCQSQGEGDAARAANGA